MGGPAASTPCPDAPLRRAPRLAAPLVHVGVTLLFVTVTDPGSMHRC